jgi:hypothetical protein
MEGSSFMTAVAGDFELTMDELRVAARFVAESAQELVPVFEEAVPGDRRPCAAVGAAWGVHQRREWTKLQRVTSNTEAARLAARSAGDAASAAYLHLIAKASQVGQIALHGS